MNQAPEARGTIPAHTIAVGGTSAQNVVGYFADPDGDALTYTAGSSNEAVATVALEGTTVTMTGVAHGTAVVTVTASDPDGASAAQGISVTVGDESVVRPATVTIFGLRDPENRNNQVDPTDVSGAVSVLLDVQYNDETVTAVALTLGDQVIPCRGTSSDAASPIGLAGSAGRVEIDCFLDTAAVPAGECTGYPVDPTHANGEHVLGARITTTGGETRATPATQVLTLTNQNYVIIDHNPGKLFIERTTSVRGDIPWYGGPSTPDNINSWDVCPVLFDDDIAIGEIIFGEPTFSAGSAYLFLAFAPSPANNPFQNSGRGVSDSSPPYTWQTRAEWNLAFEGFAQPEVMSILDPDGISILSEFAGGRALDADRLDMDFKAPMPSQLYTRLGLRTSRADSDITIGGSTIDEGGYYSDRDADGDPQPFAVSDIIEAGVGVFVPGAQTIAVGDCSIRANTDTGRTSLADTPFQPIVEDADWVSDLPEDDPTPGENPDDAGGVDCYVAELQGMVDQIGNEVRPLLERYGVVPIQSASPFGVDRTPPDIDNEAPDETLVLRDGTWLTFEFEDPDLESGDDGSGVNSDSIEVWTGSSFARKTWGGYAIEGYAEIQDGDLAIIDIDELAEGRRHTVNVAVPDLATPPNRADVRFIFTRDGTPPEWIGGGSTTGRIHAGSSDVVNIRVEGTIKDANRIEEAVLTAWLNNDPPYECGAGSDIALPKGGDGRIDRNGFDLDNNSKSIKVDQVLKLKRSGDAAGVERICVSIDTEDEAVGSEGRGPGNIATLNVAFVEVDWGLGGDPGFTVSPDAVMVDEGAAAEEYTVVLTAQPAGDVTLAIANSDAGAVTLSPAGPLTFTSDNWDTAQTIMVFGVEDDDSADETVTLTHTASGGGYDGLGAKTVDVTVDDNDMAGIDVEPEAVTVGEGSSSEYTVALTLQPTDPVTVTFEADVPGAVTLSPAGPLTFTVDDWAAGQTITVTGTDDDDADDETVTVTHTAAGVGYDGVEATVVVTVDDDETAGIGVSSDTVMVHEGAMAEQYTVVLTSQPADEVTVTIANSDDTAVMLDPAGPLTFTVDGWADPQTITVTAPADDNAADETVTVTHTAAGGGYDMVAAVDVVVVVTDAAGIGVDPGTLDVGEGVSMMYTVVLTQQPAGDVTVTIANSDDTAVTLDPAGPLTFTATTWDAAQTITVTAPEDNDGDHEVVTLTHSASGGGYDGVGDIDVVVRIADNDPLGISLIANSAPVTMLAVSEGVQADPYTVQLATQPSSDVTVTITSSIAGTVIWSPAVLVFTVDNWADPQTVTVTGLQDTNASDETLDLTHAASDGGYDGISIVLRVEVDDDDN
ncbi:Ig-like domain-containing protein [Candidatus Palauibacter sp.]|uniref:Ig-like domain-containing protein n=1 Tax=Candidatus Palauibacter sp. TaxID=3101350 RepID=UPI003B5B5842